MLEAPVDGDPARPPRLQTKFFRSRGVPANFKDVEVLSGENVPVAVEEGAAEMFRQGFESAAIVRVVSENGVVFEFSADEIVLAGVVKFRTIEACGRNFVDPQSLDPGVADVAGVGGAGHVADAAGDGAAVAGG